MCEHKNSMCVETTGEHYIYKCFEPGCDYSWKVDKYKPKKKSFIDKLLRR